MSTAAQVAHELDETTALPYDRQVPGLERLAAEADALDGPEGARLAADVRCALLSAYAFSAVRSSTLLTPFAWLVQRFDTRPDWWEQHHDHSVLWTYKWVVGRCLDDASVPLAVLDDLIAGMRERYVRRGEEPTPVLEAELKLHAHRFGAADAVGLFEAWAAAPRTAYSDCRACEPTQRLRFLASLSRHAEALEEFWPVHEGGLTCLEQPQLMYAHALPSLLLEGHGAVAAEAHLRGTRATRGRAHEAGLDALQLGHCARAGQLARALELLDARVRQVASPRDDAEGLALAAHGALLLARLVADGHGDVEVTRPDGARGPATEAHADLLARAEAWAAAFDVRNGTSAETDRLRALLDAGDLPRLELGAATRTLPPTPDERAGGRSPARSSGGSGASGAPDDRTLLRRSLRTPARLPDDLDLAGLFGAYDHAQLHGAQDLADLVATSWSQTHETHAGAAAGPDGAAMAAELDIAWLRRLEPPAGDDPAAWATGIAARSTRRLRAHGYEAEALLAEQVALVRALELGVDDDTAAGLRARVAAIVPLVDAALPDPTGARSRFYDAAELRARARGRAAATADDPADAERAIAEGLALTADVTPSSPPHARWGRATFLLWSSHHAGPEPGLAAAHEVLTVLGDGLLPESRSGALLQVAINQARLGRPDEALTHAETAFDLGLDCVDERAAVACALRTSESVGPYVPPELLNRLLALLERQLSFVLGSTSTGAVQVAVVRLGVAPSLARAGRLLEATESLELALAELGDPATRTTEPTDRGFDVALLHATLLARTADLSLTLGETDRAAALAVRAVEEATAAGSVPLAADAAGVAAQALSDGDSIEALAAYRRLAELSETLVGAGAYERLGPAHHARREVAARLLAVDGPDASARAYDDADDRVAALRARAEADDGGPDADPLMPTPEHRRHVLDHLAWETLRITQARAETRLEADDPAAALDLLAGLDAAYAALDCWRDAVIVLTLAARAHADLDDRAAAEATWERALREADTHDLPEIRRSVLHRWVWWLDHHGHEDAAAAVWARWSPDDV